MEKIIFAIGIFLPFILPSFSTTRVPFNTISSRDGPFKLTSSIFKSGGGAPTIGRHDQLNKEQLVKEVMDINGYTNGLKSGWKVAKNKETAKVWRRKVSWTPWLQIRCWALVEASPKFLVDLLLDNSRVQEYDSLVDGVSILEKPEQNTMVRHMLYKPIWPTSPRDFVVYTYKRLLKPGNKKSGYVIASQSVLSDTCPATKKRCRGTIFHFGYTLEPFKLPNGKDGTQVRMCAHMDLAGGMPASIINFLSSSQPFGVMLKLQDIAIREFNEGELTSQGFLAKTSQSLNLPTGLQICASKIDSSFDTFVKSCFRKSQQR